MKLPLLALFLATSIQAATLPGFRVETLTRTTGFASSIVTDSQGTVYFTTTDGWIHRVDGSQATRVASLPTQAGGNGGLLGMALLDDHTAVVHYTTWNAAASKVLDDVISRVDLATGAETVIHAFQCDVDMRERGVSSEHHGGNPTIAPDGSIFVGIGEYGVRSPAQDPRQNGGKVFRIDPSGTVTQWAMGVRNPYDLAFDPELDAIVLSDNGPNAGDEINVVAQGSNLGWYKTYGNEPPVEGMVPPAYVFPSTVAPTGLLRLDGSNRTLDHGYISAAFVTRALYYFPRVTGTIADPPAVVQSFDEFPIDVTAAPDGTIYFVTAWGPNTAVQRLDVPKPGDCNGDALVDYRDIVPLMREIDDGGSHPVLTAQSGDYAGSWGCDVNTDDMIDESDLRALTDLLVGRRRAVRTR